MDQLQPQLAAVAIEIIPVIASRSSRSDFERITRVLGGHHGSASYGPVFLYKRDDLMARGSRGWDERGPLGC